MKIGDKVMWILSDPHGDYHYRSRCGINAGDIVTVAELAMSGHKTLWGALECLCGPGRFAQRYGFYEAHCTPVCKNTPVSIKAREND